MKILELTYSDMETEWSIASINFESFNLLVGASGVGKTRILQSLLTLKAIAHGQVVPGAWWKVTFELDDVRNLWTGNYSNLELSNNQSNNEATLVFERLSQGDIILAERTGPELTFHSQTLPVKLSASKSLLWLLEDDGIKNIRNAFANIIEATATPHSRYAQIVPQLQKNYRDLESIREADFDIITRLTLVYLNIPQVFNRIKDDFCSLFPRVEDLKISLEPRDGVRVQVGDLPTTEASDIVILFKEFGTEWLNRDVMSSGMWKTLLLLSDLYLCKKGSVILIDEVENSLGVNCIDLIGDLTTPGRDAQYIITSHHPYIINNVPISKWKIITREGSNVQAQPASSFDLGHSKHEAFMQLMQLEAFRQGQPQE